MQARIAPLFNLKLLAALLVLSGSQAALAAAAAAPPPPVVAKELGKGVYFLEGGGGANAAALIGDDGVLVADAKLDEASAESELAAIRKLTPGNIRFLINTHEHPDHIGGNEMFGKMGAVIIAHDEVRSILAAGQRGGPPAPAVALPVLTFGNEGTLTLHLNGETVEIKHMPAAHTTNNSIVHYVEANVYQLGDIFSGDRYPTLAGGTFQGFIDGVDQVLAEANDSAHFIPGNGPVGDHAALVAYRAMLGSVQSAVTQALDSGQSLEAFLASKPTAATDATYGDPARFLTGVYNQLKGAR
ncbi:MAG: MBL fold metallo-hydrolase [Pseudomonadales bacterium]|jgi:glyoxylase-like metal-dependent hydrolase (beta-lactamase superfamily II)|nr:MBL fold metallo-hydrolase [Pseudomonadales bacterium]